MAALDVALDWGAATIMKRNRPAAIVLTPQAYEGLLMKAAQNTVESSALDWLLDASNLAKSSNTGLESLAMVERLDALKSD